MPVTPLHFGPSATLAFPLRKYIDVPVFVLVNVVIDIQPFLALFFFPDIPVHGFSHTLIGGAIVGTLFGLVMFLLKRPVAWCMKLLRIDYTPRIYFMVLAGIFGAWFHIFTDALIWSDVYPFYPSKWNPLLGVTDHATLSLICVLLFLPPFVMYIVHVFKGGKKA